MKIYKLIAVLILLPLGLNLVGVWQLQRSLDNTQRLTEIQADLLHARPSLEKLARSPSALTRTIEIDGENLSISMALSRLEEAQEGLGTVLVLGNVTTWLARAVIVLGLLAALVGAVGLAGLKWAGSRALHSRERLLHTFSRVSRVMPFVLVGHIVAMGAAVSAILSFEALGMWHLGRMSAGELKLIIVVMMVVAACLYSIWHMGKQLRVMLRMFEPVAMQVLGRQVTADEAPVLWTYVRELAERLGALSPDHIVLGMAEGFYVTSSEVSLLPSEVVLKGRTLHVPIMYLGLLDAAETSAVIGHELAHFAGEDTEYSLRFLPIYDGIGRSLGVIAETMLVSDLLPRTLLRPAFTLGLYLMESFDHAVNHWSRVRELAADAAGASLAGTAPAASALVRISAIDPLLQERIYAHIARATNPRRGEVFTKDLPDSVLHGLADKAFTLPDEEMAVQLPHPSDTHPSNGERIAALQVAADEAIRNGTRPVVAAQARAAMDHYFTNPQALRTRLTEDFIKHHVANDAEVVTELRARASTVTGDVALHEGARLRGALLSVFLGSLLVLGIFLMVKSLSLPETITDKRNHMLIAGGILTLFMLILLPALLRLCLRADKTALVLTPDHFVFANLKSPVPVHHIADFGLHVAYGTILTLYLEDDAPLPERASRSFSMPNAKVHSKKRQIILMLAQFCCDGKKLKPDELGKLLADYVNAGTARHLLQQRFKQGKR
ncbi:MULTISPECIES: M48 family metallopeptidase [Pseudomonas syringae group]|uniref:M48 family metallopeptidase n=1 Tax=Pseudomonas syringae group TaxID=136849 RepID=UPI0006B42FA6|nr:MULTISPECIES: M48 family metallopeptidase [Pseudomonas syringae group]KPB52414.1 Peptidase M48 [Pseudomonas coronafaciens pv. oryzae]KPY05369.1 Peptidase M48, Ste24p [Pseudomonas coronafaciens pv. oryzae]MCF5804104.1 M48 family metalloprotease [Pseudomonas tremae]MCF5809257.1 M48 family metalloprotease [Pseudomonas tremae]RMN36867.1 Peptidase M48, Ste24p [Pseudomonas coronafaciens pv. zizaniae]